MIKVPEVGLDVVILVNRQDVSSMELGEKVLDACLSGLDPVGWGKAEEIATGTFFNRTSGQVVQLLGKDDEQYVSWNGGEWKATLGEDGGLRPAGGFGLPDRMTVFVLGEKNRPHSVRLRRFGEEEELLPVPSGTEGELRQISGIYRSQSTGTEAIIESTGNDVFLKTRGLFGESGYPLHSLGERLWLAKGVGSMVLCFDTTGNRFRMMTGPTWGLEFVRLMHGAQ